VTLAALLLAGLVAGFIDSFVGGGGLITLPAMMLHFGVSPSAIGTNKIGGASAALMAAVVYGAKGHMPWKSAFRFAAWVGTGSVLGAAASPRLLAPVYPALLWLGTLLCVGAVLFKDRLSAVKPSEARHGKGLAPLACATGLLVGFYDGAWGPGGGTFMFLTLFYMTPLSLVACIAASKVANLASALFSLAAYASQGYVHWGLGSAVALSIAGGAFAGASVAIKHAERVVMPLLLIISGLLLWRLF
jgi:uncharacterized protein